MTSSQPLLVAGLLPAWLRSAMAVPSLENPQGKHLRSLPGYHFPVLHILLARTVNSYPFLPYNKQRKVRPLCLVQQGSPLPGNEHSQSPLLRPTKKGETRAASPKMSRDHCLGATTGVGSPHRNRTGRLAAAQL